MKKLLCYVVDMLYNVTRNKKVVINAFDLETRHLLVDNVTIDDKYMTITTLPWKDISKIRAVVSKRKEFRHSLFGKIFKFDDDYHRLLIRSKLATITSVDIRNVSQGGDQYYVVTLGCKIWSCLNLYFEYLPTDIIYNVITKLDIDTKISVIDDNDLDYTSLFRLLFPVLYPRLRHMTITKGMLISFMHMCKVSDLNVQFRPPYSSILICKIRNWDIGLAVSILTSINIITYFY